MLIGLRLFSIGLESRLTNMTQQDQFIALAEHYGAKRMTPHKGDEQVWLWKGVIYYFYDFPDYDDYKILLRLIQKLDRQAKIRVILMVKDMFGLELIVDAEPHQLREALMRELKIWKD